MAKAQKKISGKIVVRVRRAWSSSRSRDMRAAGRAASEEAIQQAAAVGTEISYLKDGVVLKCRPNPEEIQ